MSKMKQINHGCGLSLIPENINPKCVSMWNSNKKWREALQSKKGNPCRSLIFPRHWSLCWTCVIFI